MMNGAGAEARTLDAHLRQEYYLLVGEQWHDVPPKILIGDMCKVTFFCF